MAQDLFDQLEIYSARAFKRLNLPAKGSPWGNQTLSAHGVIVHYTADPSMSRVLNWFCDPAQRSQASAHLVISDRREAWAEGLDDGLEAVRALPTTTILCRPLSAGAWHATWTNPTHVGIELVNPGELRPVERGFAWWKPRDNSAPEWSTLWMGAVPQRRWGRLWAPYPSCQLSALYTVLSGLCTKLRLAPGQILGHEHVQGTATLGAGGNDKRDPGPLLPLGPIREALGAHTAQPNFDMEWRARLSAEALHNLGWPGDEVALLRQVSGETTAQPPLSSDPATTAALVDKAALAYLGYPIAQLTTPNLAAPDVLMVGAFQRLMGLKQDGALGSVTRSALRARVADRTRAASPTVS